PTKLNDSSISHHGFHSEHVIDRNAVLQSMRTAAVCGDIAANGARTLAGRIWSIVISGAAQCLREPGVNHTWLNNGVSIAHVQLFDDLHSREHNHDSAADR